MMLLEVVSAGSPEYLALDDWGQDNLRYLALGNLAKQHVATVVFDPVSTEARALEIFDPEGVTWVWVDPALGIDIPGQRIDSVQALQSLAYLLKADNDIT
jgi:hypothetical protein